MPMDSSAGKYILGGVLLAAAIGGMLFSGKLGGGFSSSPAGGPAPAPGQPAAAGAQAAPKAVNAENMRMFQPYSAAVADFMKEAQRKYPEECRNWRGIIKRVGSKDPDFTVMQAKIMALRQNLFTAKNMDWLNGYYPAVVMDMFFTSSDDCEVNGVVYHKINDDDRKCFDYICSKEPVWVVEHACDLYSFGSGNGVGNMTMSSLPPAIAEEAAAKGISSAGDALETLGRCMCGVAPGGNSGGKEPAAEEGKAPSEDGGL